MQLRFNYTCNKNRLNSKLACDTNPNNKLNFITTSTSFNSYLVPQNELPELCTHPDLALYPRRPPLGWGGLRLSRPKIALGVNIVPLSKLLNNKVYVMMYLGIICTEATTILLRVLSFTLGSRFFCTISARCYIVHSFSVSTIQ